MIYIHIHINSKNVKKNRFFQSDQLQYTLNFTARYVHGLEYN